MSVIPMLVLTKSDDIFVPAIKNKTPKNKTPAITLITAIL
jgi:hypothetical protein